MPGGLLNLITSGEENVLLNGNPTKSFFKSVYSKYTNFGLQKFRLDYKGIRSLLLTESCHLSFTVPRHGDLLMDTYFVITLPDIYSCTNIDNDPSYNYHFKWIPNIGSEIIQEVEVHAGGHTLQKISGTGINLLASRDFSYNKKKTFDDMTGNVVELNDPKNYANNNGTYPTAKYYTGEGPSAPSINGRTLYVPLPFWFCQNSQQALPLVALQYTEVVITFKLRPIKDLFTIVDSNNNDIKPNFNTNEHQFYKFIRPPTSSGEYENKSTDWNHDMHLIANYAFLSKEENNVFISRPQTYLIKDVYENIFYDLVGHNKIKTFSSFLVVAWMFGFKRSDVSERNGWSNFTNWEYSHNEMVTVNKEGYMPLQNGVVSGSGYVCPPSSENNKKEILINVGIQIDGKYRENIFDAGVFKYISTFSQSPGNLTYLPHIYNYNFCLDTASYKSLCCPSQPNGAINLSSFKDIEIETTTIIPPIHDEPMTRVECGPSGEIISITKNLNSIYHYTFDMYLLEERYNVLTVTNGTCGLRYAR